MRILQSIAFLASTLLIGASSVRAQSSGTYVVDGGSYSVVVEASGDELVVIEPNKRSVYRRHGKTKEFRAFHESSSSTFTMTVVDDRTLRASRIPQTIPPTMLRLVGAAAAKTAADKQQRFEAIAERYRVLAEGDTDNAQTWSFCAAAAKGWALKSEIDAATYAWRAGQQLKTIMVDPTSTPCRDAIPQSLWDSEVAPTAGSALASVPQPPTGAKTAAKARATTGSASAGSASAGSVSAGTASAAQRTESPEAAALRERAATSAAAVSASNAELESRRAEQENAAREQARGQLQGEATKAAAKVAAKAGGGRMIGDLASVAPMLPSAEQWVTAWKDHVARKKAIAAQDEYVALVRQERLASGAPDVQGFAKPLRPTPDQVVLPAWQARVTGAGVWPEYDPNLDKFWLEKLDEAKKAKLTANDFYLSQELRPRAHPEDWRPGFSATLAHHLARVQVVIESSTGQLPKFQNYTCRLFGTDGTQLATGMLTAQNDTKRHLLEVRLVAREWAPGTYGVECGPLYGAPFVNLTFDVTA